MRSSTPSARGRPQDPGSGGGYHLDGDTGVQLLHSGRALNAIDWASRPYGDSAWEGKPVAVMGASVGTLGTARAQYHLRQVFVFLNMHALNRPEVMISNAAQRFDAQGQLTDTTTQDLIRQLLRNLVDWTRQREPVGKP